MKPILYTLWIAFVCYEIFDFIVMDKIKLIFKNSCNFDEFKFNLKQNSIFKDLPDSTILSLFNKFSKEDLI